MGRGRKPSAAKETAAQKKTLDKIIKQTRDLKNEQMRVVDKNGNVILEKKGKAHAITSTVGEMRNALDRENGAVIIHNHPAGGTFSEEDFNEFGYGAKESIVATPEGTYRLIAKDWPKTPNWPALEYDYRQAFPKDLSPLELRNRARDNLRNSVPMRKMAAMNKEFERIHKQDTEAAKEYARRTKDEYEKWQKEYTKLVDKEVRRLEVKPAHDWLRQNASKYGFSYIFRKRGG